MDLSAVQGQPQRPSREFWNDRNRNGPNKQFSGQRFYCGHSGHMVQDCWHRIGVRLQRYQGRSLFMDAQGYNGRQPEYGVVLPPPPPVGQPSATTAENQPKN